MPSGKTHDIANVVLILFGITVIVSYNVLSKHMDEDIFNNCLILFVSAYAFSTFLLSPDLDLKRNRSKLNWGFLRWIWQPYSKVFKHRGISHSILWGILTRLIYIYAVYFTALLIYYFFSDMDFNDLPFLFVDSDEIRWQYITALLLGVYIPSIFHTVLDRAVTGIKTGKAKKSKPLNKKNRKK